MAVRLFQSDGINNRRIVAVFEKSGAEIAIFRHIERVPAFKHHKIFRSEVIACSSERYESVDGLKSCQNKVKPERIFGGKKPSQ